MADENPLGPQPDFDLISDELKKVRNLPTITNGQQILVELREIRQGIAGLTTDVANLTTNIANTRRDLISMMTASYV